MTRPCYPWYCAECGSAINDRTNHMCTSKLKSRQYGNPLYRYSATTLIAVDRVVQYRLNVWFK